MSPWRAPAVLFLADGYAYRSSDAWVLLAVVYAGRKGGADVQAIVGAADYINHAILGYREFQDGVLKLAALGLVEQQAALFAPTAATLQFYDGLPGKQRAVRKDLEDMERLLRYEAARARHLREGRESAGVTEEEFDTGVRAYSKWADGVIDRMFRRRKKKPS